MILSAVGIGILSLGALRSPAMLAEQAPVPSDFTLAKALPQEVSGWQKSRDDEVYDRNDIFNYHDGAGELYLAFDFRFVFVREYVRPESPVDRRRDPPDVVIGGRLRRIHPG